MRLVLPILFASALLLGTGCKKLFKKGEDDPKPKAASTTATATATTTGISGVTPGTATATATATGAATTAGIGAAGLGGLADIGSKPAAPATDSIWKTLTAKGEKFT